MSLPPGPSVAARRRRRWPVWVVAGWIVVVAGLAWWSVRHDPATVPEQRDIADALPVLERATGALLAAAQGDGRVVLLGELRISRDCTVTPVRGGLEATREVTVYVPVDRATGVLEDVAAKLPPGYAAESGSSSGGRRIGLHADAGGFVAINAAADSDTQVLQIEASTGCRPGTAEAGDAAPAGARPAVLVGVLRALGGTGDDAATETLVTCPGGQPAGTYTVSDLPAPRNLGGSLRTLVEGAQVSLADPGAWAYRTGTDSVVVEKDGSIVRVSVTTACQ